MQNTINADIAHSLKTLKSQSPLVHNITNYVVMNYTANALLAVGAAPIMAHSRDEVEDMIAICNSLVLNIGTLEADWVDSMLMAAKKANSLNIPIVLDPVGAGATPYRTQAARKILDNNRIAVIRGNASEILALGAELTTSRGVDSTNSVAEAKDVAHQMAKDFHTVVAITGAVDFVTNGEDSFELDGGTAMMPCVTGTGCTASALIGAFTACHDNPLIAATAALSLWNCVGEIAAQNIQGPGSLGVALLDTLYTLTPESLEKKANIKYLPVTSL